MPAPPVDAPPSKSLRIFVVEDHRDTREYLRMYLEILGHTVQTADSVAQALERLPQADCEVLISDIGLPDGDGWELLRRVQGQLPHPIYAIAMSAYGMPSDQRQSQEAGFRHHLLKPPKHQELEAVLDLAKEFTQTGN